MSEQTNPTDEPTEPTEPTEPDGATAPPAPTALARYPETLAVARLAAGAEVPAWAESSSVFAIVASAQQTTVVCAGRSVPKKVPHRKPFIAFEVPTPEQSPGDLAPLVAVLAPLAEDSLDAFPVITFDAVWVLVPASLVNRAEEAWRRSGFTVTPAVPV